MPKIEADYKHPPFFRDLPVPKFLVRAFLTPASRGFALLCGALCAASYTMYSDVKRDLNDLKQEQGKIRGKLNRQDNIIGYLSHEQGRKNIFGKLVK
jgi:hypothetical protein